MAIKDKIKEVEGAEEKMYPIEKINLKHVLQSMIRHIDEDEDSDKKLKDFDTKEAVGMLNKQLDRIESIKESLVTTIHEVERAEEEMHPITNVHVKDQIKSVLNNIEEAEKTMREYYKDRIKHD